MLTSCKTKKVSETAHLSALIAEDEQAGQFGMSVKNAQLVGKQKTINLNIKVVGKDNIPCIQDFKLQAKFLEEQTFESTLSYENATNQKEFVTHISKALKGFKDVVTKATTATRKQLTIPINLKLNPAEQATKLTLEIELLDQQDQVLHKLEVIWRKGKLLVYNIDELIEEQVGSFILKNTTNNAFDTNKIELTLSTPSDIICHFIKTNTNTATLKQLLQDDMQSLESDTETKPIELKVTQIAKNKSSKNEIKLIITQEVGKATLATHKIPYKHNEKPTSSEKETSQERTKAQKKGPASKQQENAPSQEGTTSTKPQETTQEQEVDNTNSGKQGHTSEKDEEKQSRFTNPLKTSDKINTSQQATYKKKTASKKKKRDQTNQQQPTTDKQQEESKNSPTVVAELATEQKNVQLQEEPMLQPTAQKTAQPDKNSTDQINTRSIKLEKNESLEDQSTHIISNNDGISNKSEQIERSEEKELPPSCIPDLQLMIEQKSTKQKKLSKKFLVHIQNKGPALNKEALGNVILKYNVKGAGDLTNVRLKKRRNPIAIYGAKISDLLNSELVAGKAASFELLIESGDAENLTIELFLEGIKSPHTNLAHWQKEEKTNKQNKLKSGLVSDLELSLDERSDEHIKMFNLLLKNNGEAIISKEPLNNIKIKYTIEGTGDLTDVRLTRRKSKFQDIQGQRLGDLLNQDIDPGTHKKFQLIINSANADSLIIQISLEGVECMNMVLVNWKKKEKVTPRRKKG